MKDWDWQPPVPLRSRKRVGVIFLLLLPLLFLGLRYFYFGDAYFAVPGAYGHGRPAQVARQNFIAKAMEVEYASAMEMASIQEVCAQKNWTEGLVLSCAHIHGGIGNVRNHILNCVRYAIEAGGALVIPGISERNASDIANIYTDDIEDMGYLLDRPAFVARLTEGCPGLQLLERLEDFPYAANIQQTLTLVPRGLEPEKPVRTGLHHPERWRQAFYDWLGQNVTTFSATEPVHVRLDRAYLEFPIYHDGESFALNFGKVLRFYEEARYLAAAALWELHTRFGLPIDPDLLVSTSNATYFGTHFRLEDDAVKAWPGQDWPWQRFEKQTQAQIDEIRGTDLRVVYIACGDRDMAHSFGDRAREALPDRNLTFVMKHELLQGKDLRRLDRMTFDQQGLVDFLVMLKANRFAGVGHSSFAWNVALRRHELSGLGRAMTDGPKRRLLDDGLSVVLGYEENLNVMMDYQYTMWP